jgi:hypothetical protein
MNRLISQGAGDAVDLRPGAGHPYRASLGIAGREFRGGHQRQFGGLPAFEAALQRFGIDAEMSQPGRGALGELLAAQADDNGRTSGEFSAPIGGLLMVTFDGTGNQPRVGGKVLVGAHVDQDRHIRRADQSCKFVRGY